MTLDAQQRLSILSDILRSHLYDCCGTTSEYEQAGRIARTLLDEGVPREEMRDALSSIQHYTDQGIHHTNPEQYILENQTHLNGWVSLLDHYSKP
ncbi:MAG TPA: YtzH-like family protein [Bacillales bacterium]|nr:YtzH-like family protein [Bacillales bacterium]